MKNIKESKNMVRGCEKRIYYVKNPESDIFDEAYLVLRRQEADSLAGKCTTDEEMRFEAMRILSGISGNGEKNEKERSKIKFARAFVAGAALSAALTATITAIIYFAV
ncbi:MAG: hypothetical protein HFE30_06960 [Clostridiales bacterium]|nr:hypothetical protein [Clostridiales bacterium]